MWSKNRVSHSSVFICYFSKITETTTKEETLTARTFAIELFSNTDTKENVLSIKGPIANTRDYKCSEFYLIDANMNELIEIAKTTMNAHGKYDYFRNNCRHFSGSFLKMVKQKCVALSVDVPCETVTEYLHEFGIIENDKVPPNLITDDVEEEDNEKMPQDSEWMKHFVAHAAKNVSTCPEPAKVQDKRVEALSFVKVLKQFPLHK